MTGFLVFLVHIVNATSIPFDFFSSLHLIECTISLRMPGRLTAIQWLYPDTFIKAKSNIHTRTDKRCFTHIQGVIIVIVVL